LQNKTDARAQKA